MSLDELFTMSDEMALHHHRVLDFGPHLKYIQICTAYTVEKLSMWKRIENNQLELVVLRAPYMPRARLEGILYNLRDEELGELDKERGLGVQCERKRVGIILPDESTHFAYIYMGLKEYWLERIEWGANWRSPRDRTFQLARQIPDTNPLLNNRFSFHLPQPNGRVGQPPQSVINNIRKRNRTEMRLLYFDQMRKRLNKFVNDE